MTRDSSERSDDKPEPDVSRDAEDKDELDEIGRESFPASDPPSTWSGTSGAEPGATPHR